MIGIHYLLQTSDDLEREGIDCLTPHEREVDDAFRFDKPRADWRLGRLTGKRALARVLGAADSVEGWRRIEILAAADGAPEATLDGSPVPAVISLSHSNAWALCAVSADAAAVGCDIESVETRRAIFVDTFFTATELAAWELAASAERDLLATLIWSAKESALKLLRTGLRLDTRSIEIDIGHSGSTWQPFTARYDAAEREWSGWWQQHDNFVLTALAEPDGNRPVLLG